MAKISKINKLVKILDVIPDTTRVIGDAIHAAAPIVHKALEQNYEKKNRLVRLPNVVDMDMAAAKEHLEELGFTVSVLVARPRQSYAQRKSGEVVATSPKSGKLEPGSLVKLYYVTEEVLAASQAQQDLPDVCGLDLAIAREHLEDLGLKPIPLLLEPHAKYASKKTGVVLAMSPKPLPLLTNLAKGSLVKLYYLDEKGSEHSQTLARKQKSLPQEVQKIAKKIPDLLPKKKK